MNYSSKDGTKIYVPKTSKPDKKPYGKNLNTSEEIQIYTSSEKKNTAAASDPT